MPSNMTNIHFSSKTVEWATPPGFAEKYGPFDLDPAATAENAKAPKFFTKAEDGLAQDWGSGRVWLNPPYGRGITGLWVKKAYEASLKGATVVCLLPARTDTKWFHDYVLPYGKIKFLKGRLKFGGGKDSAPFPSMVVTFNLGGKDVS